jgi:hypothetical protein
MRRSGSAAPDPRRLSRGIRGRWTSESGAHATHPWVPVVASQGRPVPAGRLFATELVPTVPSEGEGGRPSRVVLRLAQDPPSRSLCCPGDGRRGTYPRCSQQQLFPPRRFSWLTARAPTGPTFRVGLPRKSLRVQDIRGVKSAMPEARFESLRRTASPPCSQLCCSVASERHSIANLVHLGR